MSVPIQVLTCPRCEAVLPHTAFNLSELRPCPSCGRGIQVEIFPALFQTTKGTTAENIAMEGESSCFYHPQKKAVIPCDGCGRFLCSLCDIDLNGQRLCPVCLETGKKKRTLKELENRRTLYDHIAVSLAIMPLILCFWPSLLGAPASLFVVIKYWNTPCGLLSRSKIWFVIAGVLAGLQIATWAVLIAYWIVK